jgi:hypothetical protein
MTALTVQSLRALTQPITAGTFTTLLSGYYATNDGGGGHFVWTTDTTSVDDLGTVVVPASTPRTGCWKRIFADELNVKWFGAVGGDGLVDDTAAIQAALLAASHIPFDAPGGQYGYGGVVMFPHGRYLVTSKLVVNKGVSIIGEGRQTTEIKFTVGASIDGIGWESVTPTYGGCLRDIALVATAQNQCRNLVSLSQCYHFDIANCDIQGAGNNGIKISDCTSVTCQDSIITGNYNANVWVGTAGGGSSTTIRFRGCYFSLSTIGPGADVAGLGINFESCIFESNGISATGGDKLVKGYGIRVRGGNASLISSYFEDNCGWAMHLGTTDNTWMSVIDPLFQNGPNTTAGVGCILANKVLGGCFLGGDYSSVDKSIEFTALSVGVSVLGSYVGPHIPLYNVAGGKTISDYPGYISYADPGTGEYRLDGTHNVQIKGGVRLASITKGTYSWAGGPFAPNAYYTFIVPCVGSDQGDYAQVTCVPFAPNGMLCSASVVNPGDVNVTFYNPTVGTITFAATAINVMCTRIQ